MPLLEQAQGSNYRKVFSSKEFSLGSLQIFYWLLYSKMTQNDSKKKDPKEVLFPPLFQSSKNLEKEGTLGNIETPYWLVCGVLEDFGVRFWLADDRCMTPETGIQDGSRVQARAQANAAAKQSIAKSTDSNIPSSYSTDNILHDAGNIFLVYIVRLR